MPAYRIEHAPDLPHGLGRHVNHDERSRDFPFASRPEADVAIETVRWKRRVPIFDQGQLGSCTGNAAVGWLVTDDDWRRGLTRGGVDADTHGALNEADAVYVYGQATRIDPFDGAYPPDDTGSDGLSVVKVLLGLGWVDGYSHGFTVDDGKRAIQTTPFLIGIPWARGMFDPDPDGLVEVSGPWVGGHELVVVGYDVDGDYFDVANSWGAGWGLHGYCRFRATTLAMLLANDGDLTVPHTAGHRHR